MVSTIRLAENDDSEACDNIFQTGHLMSRNLDNYNDKYQASDSILQSGHLLGRNAVQREFHTNSSKVLL